MGVQSTENDSKVIVMSRSTVVENETKSWIVGGQGDLLCVTQSQIGPFRGGFLVSTMFHVARVHDGRLQDSFRPAQFLSPHTSQVQVQPFRCQDFAA